MLTQELSYALAKQVPDMERGFTIQTNYGELIVQAEDAKPFIAAITKLLKRELRQTEYPVTNWTPALQRAVFTCVINGGTYKEAAEISGVSVTRVTSVIARMRRKMEHPSRMDEVNQAVEYGVAGLRKHAEFWLRRLDKLFPPDGTFPGVSNDQ